MKMKRCLIVFIIILLLSIDTLSLYSGIVVYAIAKEISSDIYLVNDTCIERVYPNTTIQDFEDNLKENVIIYEDKTMRKKISTGIVKTGMVVQKIGGTKKYTISVIGDINKDGLFNQTDISLLIKYITGMNDYELEDETFRSADIKYDKKVNQIDLTSAIQYVVFGKLDNEFTRDDEEEIDKPIINSFREIAIDAHSIKVQVIAKDGIGLNSTEPYTYMISKNENLEDYEVVKSTENECLFEGLKNNTTYYIKVIVKNVIELTTESTTLKVSTDVIPTLNDENDAGTKILEISDIMWKDEKASINIVNRSKYITQYKIINSEDSIIQDWTSTREKTKNVQNLYHNYIVVIRLAETEDTTTESENFGKEAKILIKDEVKPEIKLKEQEEYTINNVEVMAQIIENESGIEVQKWASGEQNIEYFENSGNLFANDKFTVNSNGIYTVYAKDKAGNEAISNINVTKIDKENLKISISNYAENIVIKKNEFFEVTVKSTREISEIDERKMTLDGNGRTGIKFEIKKQDENTVIIKIIAGEGNGNISLNIQEGAFKDAIGNINQGVIKENIAYIDNSGPKIISFSTTDVTTNSIRVMVSAEETEGAGLAEKNTYSYYISQSPQFENEVPISTTDTTCQFDNLIQNTRYYLQVIVQDKIGNKTVSQSVVATTATVPSASQLDPEKRKLNIEFSNTEWKNEQAQLKITNNSKFNMQYKILDDTNREIQGWTNVQQNEITINNLKNKYNVIARLSDSKNLQMGNYGGEKSQLIFDSVFPSLSIWQGAQKTVNVTVTENESGVEVKKWAQGEQLNEEYFKNGGTVFTGNSFNVSSNGRYTVYVKDKAGNETIDTIKITEQGAVLSTKISESEELGGTRLLISSENKKMLQKYCRNIKFLLKFSEG